MVVACQNPIHAMKKAETPQWDVIIVGGGPAGLSAAVLLARMKRSVLLFDAGKQRNRHSHGMHNYLTRDGILPKDYLALARLEATGYGVTILDRSVRSAARKGDYLFEVGDSEHVLHTGRRLLLATGVEDIVPDIPGMQELWGCAVHHCPYCDGWECKDATIGIYASKINGYGEALALHHLSNSIVLFTEGGYRLKPAQLEQLAARNIAVETGKIDRLDHTGQKLHGVRMQDGRLVPCEKIFVNNGQLVHDTLLKGLDCKRTKKGNAICNRKQQTSVPGVYVAGDASIGTHFVVVAAAEGAKAGVSMHEDMLDWDNREALEAKDQSF